MKKYYYIIYISTFICFIIGCSSSSIKVERNALIGVSNFTIYDSTEGKIGEGILEIKKNDNNILSGIYKIMKYPDVFPDYWPKEGFFEGNYNSNDNKIFLNMNPKLADNNVFINASRQNDSLFGKWSYSTILGESASGVFKAGKVK
ncbi:MAG: hypothetical protein ACRDFC_01805 [Ignavibacteria bacterium]